MLPEELVRPVEALATESYISPPIFVQAALLESVRGGHFHAGLERVRRELGARRDAMLAALEREFPEGSEWSRPDGGYFLWLDFPPGVPADALLARATEEGVTFVKGSDFYAGSGGDAGGRFAGAGALKCFAAIGGKPFHAAGQIGMSWPRPVQRRKSAAAASAGRIEAQRPA